MIGDSSDPTTTHDHDARTIALVGGGTAGHVSPALAVAAAYRARRPGARVLFLGRVTGFGARMVEARGGRIEPIPAVPFYRVPLPARARVLSHLLAGVRHARRVLARERAALVLGFGGYASAAAVLAARSLGMATAVHESNATIGLANRLLGRVVDRVLLGDLTGARAFASRNARWTGTPVRPDVTPLVAEARRPPAAGRLRLFVCGGSEGSPFLNRQAPSLAQALADRGLALDLHHQSGGDDPAVVQARYAGLGVDAAVTAYVDDVAAAYRWADLVVTVAGASTLAELAVAGLPALLVPLSTAAADHQAANAAAYAAATGAPWVRESAWDAPALAAQLDALLRDRAAWQRWSERTRALGRIDAAERVVDECEALLT